MQDPPPFGQQQPSLSFPEHEQLKCPRCDSTNTKFCYYNNYNLSQPRHFCKSCRRYWTKGGTLRSIPVGGGTRKRHKRSNPEPDPNPDLRPKVDHHPDLNTPGSGGTRNQETELRGDAGSDCFFRPGSRFQ